MADQLRVPLGPSGSLAHAPSFSETTCRAPGDRKANRGLTQNQLRHAGEGPREPKPSAGASGTFTKGGTASAEQSGSKRGAGSPFLSVMLARHPPSREPGVIKETDATFPGGRQRRNLKSLPGKHHRLAANGLPWPEASLLGPS